MKLTSLYLFIAVLASIFAMASDNPLIFIPGFILFFSVLWIAKNMEDDDPFDFGPRENKTMRSFYDDQV